jgi:TolA-binding protein
MNLCKEHWISIPEDKTNVVDEMADELREMEERLNEQIERNVELNNRLAESSKVVILNQVSEGLADTQKEKLASLSEGVRYETAEQFTEAVKTLRKSYFPESVAKSEVGDDAPVALSEDVSPAMAAYVQALSRWK